VKTDIERMLGREKGYAYFQDFIPNNNTDTRIIIIGDKAFAIIRGVRKGDFRASGSGVISYNHKEVDLNCVKIAFGVAQKLKTQCLTFDFVHLTNNPLIVEISYGFSPKGYLDCPGYWDLNLDFHFEKKPLAEYILTSVIKKNNEPIN
jgi:glutathione synthase/RimK-type ligase-like ATP-grasp enzyme